MVEEKKEIDFKIEDKRLVLWRDILKQAEDELAKTEEIYFKNKEFNEAVILQAKEKIKEYGSN